MKRGYIDWELWSAIIVICLTTALVIAAVSSVVVKNRAARACLDHGWPDSKVVFPYAPYCIKRVNQTDTVVALKNIR